MAQKWRAFVALAQLGLLALLLLAVAQPVPAGAMQSLVGKSVTFGHAYSAVYTGTENKESFGGYTTFKVYFDSEGATYVYWDFELGVRIPPGEAIATHPVPGSNSTMRARIGETSDGFYVKITGIHEIGEYTREIWVSLFPGGCRVSAKRLSDTMPDWDIQQAPGDWPDKCTVHSGNVKDW